MKKLSSAVACFFLFIPSIPAHALSLAAAGGATICDQTVDNTSSVLAYQVSNGDCVIEFKRVGTTTWTIPTGISTVTYLVVAGGGGGAGGQASEHGGGGGGAGGVLAGNTSVSAGNVSIVVGAGGGAGGAASAGGAGGNSSFGGAVVAVGGGRGGTYFTYGPTVGGSGGGAGAGNLTTGSNGTAGQGNKGGNVTSSTTNGRHGGGGGGASTAGGNTTTPSSPGVITMSAGTGGDGLLSSITDSPVTYAGGGGGGGSTRDGGTGGASGGAGGGGRGATYDGNTLTLSATAGTANLGAGGGGGIGTGGGNASAGAAGGSGIVIIRYQPGPVNTAIPSISGIAEYGETLTASNGTWSYSPTSYTYQWKRSATSGGSYTNISGATSSAYVPVAADISQYLKVTVTAANANGSAAATSDATFQVVRGVSIPALSIAAGDLIYRTTKVLTATSTISGKATFKANREVITKCKNLVLNSSNSYSRTCDYKPSRHGSVVLTLIFVPTDSNYDSVSVATAPYFVKTRTGPR